MKNSVILPYNTQSEIKTAAIFIAALITNSTVLFSAHVKGDVLVIEFSGGC